eukprot:Awhi_evm2s15182
MSTRPAKAKCKQRLRYEVKLNENNDTLTRNFYLIKEQCLAKTANGEQCKNMVLNTHPLCALHVKKIFHVHVDLSTIPECKYGLFALKPFKKNEILALFYGENLSVEELNQRYCHENELAPMVMVAGDQIIDCCKVKSAGAFINHNTTGNCTIVNDGTASELKTMNEPFYNPLNVNNYLLVRALRDINQGEEIFINYGTKYNVTDIKDYTTKNFSINHKSRARKRKFYKKDVEAEWRRCYINSNHDNA